MPSLMPMFHPIVFTRFLAPGEPARRRSTPGKDAS